LYFVAKNEEIAWLVWGSTPSTCSEPLADKTQQLGAIASTFSKLLHFIDCLQHTEAETAVMSF
jgi:hypothetical protein